MTPEVIRRQVVVEEHDLSSDGRLAVVVRRHVARNGYVCHLWLVPLDGGPIRRLTGGPHRDREPRFSPDGRWVAFRSARPDGDGADRAAGAAGHDPRRVQVFVVPVEGGEPRRLTRQPHDVDGFAWSPDGSAIAILGSADPPRFMVGQRRAGQEPLARVIDRGGWRWDETGKIDFWRHLFVQPFRPEAREAPAAPAVQVTAGEFSVESFDWDADGRSLVFTAAIHDLADLYPRPRVYRVSADGSAADAAEAAVRPVEVAALRGLVDRVSASPDGRWLVLTGVDVEGAPDWAAPGLFLAPPEGPAASPETGGSARPRPLAPDLDLPVGAWVDSDLLGWDRPSRPGPFWTVDRDGRTALVALVSRGGRCDPWRFPLDPATGRPIGQAAPLADPAQDAACWTLAASAGGPVTVCGTLRGRAMELMVVEGGRYRTQTRSGSAWQRRVRQPELRNLWIAGPGGPIETWLASPTGAGDAPLPTVVDIHGGPLGAWAPAPSLEVQLLVASGYRVALPNIRGSAGYGAGWIRPHLGHWGEVDADDVHAVLDRLVAAGLADPARLGALGLSYGGFLVNWLVGTSDRFAAAVSESGVTNQVAVWANSDSGPDYNRRAGLGEPFDEAGVERLWRQSPLRHVANVRTPLLMLQGEADLRCPPQDNEQFFLALRALGRTVEYVLYPGEYHVYQATGRPDRRIDRMTRILDWFDRYLERQLGTSQATSVSASP